MLVVPLVVSGLSGAACSHKGSASAVSEPQTEDEKTFYALGLMLGRNIGTFTPSDRELALIEAGLSDQATKSKAKVDIDKYGPTIDALARKRAAARTEPREEQERCRDRRRVQRAWRHQAPVGHGHQDDPSRHGRAAGGR